MPAWAYTPTSINGAAIVGGSVSTAYFRVANGPGFTQPVDAVQATIPGKGSADVRGQPKPTIWRLVVNLSGVNQTDLAALHTLFDEQAGLVYLRVTDGAGVVWRTAVRTIGIEPVNTVQFEVVLSVPNPTWEEDNLTTDSKLNQTASPIAINLTNNGTRKARPKFSITADAAKSIVSVLDDYAWSLQGFLVNRAPNDIVDKPVYLFDSAGAASRLVTDTSAAGATVRQTTGATTLTADPGAGGTTIAVTELSGFAAGGGIAVIAWVTGPTFGTMEAIYYTGKSAPSGAGNLTGCVRGIGGTTAQAHAAATAINPSGTLPDGRDCRVWLDDVADIDRWLVGWNGTASDVVINVSLPRGIALTRAAAITAGTPANGGAISFNEDVSLLPPKGFFALENEVIYYASRAGRQVSGIQRACWGTTAASHAINATAWANPRHFVVGCGYAKAGAPPSPSSRRPCIQLPGSSNQAWKYGDQADDASTIYFDRSAPDRTAQWVPGFDLDGNAVAPLMQLSASGNILTFKDDVPGDGSPPYNFAELSVPMGIKKADANAIINDWTPAAEILNLELFTRDSGGVLKLQDQLQQSAAAAARALPAALVATAYGVKLKGRYNIVTGHRGDALYQTISNAAMGDDSSANSRWQNFTLDQDTPLTAMCVLLAREAADQDILIRLRADTGPNYYAGQQYLSTTITVNSATPSLYRLRPSGTAAIGYAAIIPAGKYYLTACRAGAANGNVRWYSKDGGRYNRGIPSVGTEQLYFYAETGYLPDGTTPIQKDQPVRANTALRTATPASFDKTILTLEPAQTVYVHRMTAFVSGATAGSLLHCVPVIANTTTGDSIGVDKWMKPTSTLVIDCDQRTVVYTEDSVDYPVTKAIAPSNTADWLALVAGANALTWTEPSLLAPGQVDIVTTWRGVKV